MSTALDNLPPSPRVSTEDLMRAMPQPIAVVGNGPVEKPYGELIDSHATIIRFNNFRLSGHEAAVGSRTTHWCVNGVVDRRNTGRRWLQRAIDLVFPWRQPGILINPHVDERTECFTPRAFDWLLVENCRRGLRVDVRCVGDATLLYSLHAFVPFPTIGFATLFLLLKFQPQVSIFGFRGLAQGHYWDQKHRHSRGHLSSAAKELALLQSTPRIQFHL